MAKIAFVVVFLTYYYKILYTVLLQIKAKN